MADNTNKDAEGKDEKAKKKGLPAIVLVVAGAVLGGAGVVFAVPPKVVVEEVEHKPPPIIDVEHPDIITHTFNPKSKSTRAVLVEFNFIYTCPQDKKEEAYHQIKERWSYAKSNTFIQLKNRPIEDYETERGITVLNKDLIDTLDATLFRRHEGEPYPKVTRVLFHKIMIQ